MSFLTSIRPCLPKTAATTRLFSTSPASRVARLTVVGRLAATPELITTDSGREFVRYAIGTNHGSGDNRTTSWWKVASFAEAGPGRDRLLGLSKGSLVYVEGEASMRKFEREGRTETALSIVQSKLDVLKRNEPSSSEDAVETD